MPINASMRRPRPRVESAQRGVEAAADVDVGLAVVIDNATRMRQVNAEGRLAGIQQCRQSAAPERAWAGPHTKVSANGAGAAHPGRQGGQNRHGDPWPGA